MNRVKSDGMIPDPVPFVPVPLTDEYRTLANNPVLDNHNQFVGELVKDAVKIGRFVPVVGSVIVIVEGTVAAGKHGVYMLGLLQLRRRRQRSDGVHDVITGGFLQQRRAW